MTRLNWNIRVTRIKTKHVLLRHILRSVAAVLWIPYTVGEKKTARIINQIELLFTFGLRENNLLPERQTPYRQHEAEAIVDPLAAIIVFFHPCCSWPKVSNPRVLLVHSWKVKFGWGETKKKVDLKNQIICLQHPKTLCLHGCKVSWLELSQTFQRNDNTHGKTKDRAAPECPLGLGTWEQNLQYGWAWHGGRWSQNTVGTKYIHNITTGFPGIHYI